MSDKPQQKVPEKQAEKPKPPAHPCPICFGTMAGAGREYSRHGKVRYLRCTGCGHTWTEKPKPGAVEIAYRTVVTESR